MKLISANIQKRARELRRKGLSHRDIAKLLPLSKTSAIKYTRDIYISPKQTKKLRARGIYKVQQKFSKRERLEFSRRGGRNNPNKFQVKYSRKDLIKMIQRFFNKTGRIPLKREMASPYRAFLRVFGNWNKAIEAAGLAPNAILFAKKFIANDGHKCDSLSEKIIDDWLYSRKIFHRVNVCYPGEKFFTADFVVGDVWIEFFGLSGELRSYDDLKYRKLKVARKFNLKLIQIYPQDLFPESRLDEILGFLNKR